MDKNSIKENEEESKAAMQVNRVAEMKRFKDLGLHEWLIQNLQSVGIEKPT